MKTLLPLLLLPAVFLTACSQEPGAGTSGFPDDFQLERPLRGEAAITGLGARLDEVAARHRMTPDQLRGIFRQDGSLVVDRHGRLLYSEEAPGAQEAAQAAALPFNPVADTIAADQTFRLHSLPSTSKKLYLNFRGGTVSNTAWNYGAPPIEALPYSQDADPAFSTAELREIRAMWLAIAEDYAPFEIDVTTEAPPAETLTQPKSIEIIFTPSSEWYGRAGGVCYVGNFDWTSERKVCWVFSALLNNNTKMLTEAASHEAGHSLGLNHWAKYNADGSLAATYYPGHGSWAPIMGVGYYRPITTWSKGEYEGAGIWALGNRVDDVEILARSTGYRADDAADTTAAAAALPRSGTGPAGPIEAERVFHSAADRDYFKLDLGAPGLWLQVTAAAWSPNVLLHVKLMRENGDTVVELSPDSPATPLYLDQSTLPAGVYFLEIRPIGYGNPATTGYSSYGSIGRYFISGEYAPGASEGGSTPTPSPTPAVTPTPSVEPSPTPEIFNYRQVVARYDQSCAITQSRKLHCWGQNSGGQLGQPAPAPVTSAIPLAIDPTELYQQIAIGVRHACGLTLDGVVKCWGENQYGNLGDGTFQYRATPVVADQGVRYRQIAVGYRHTCGVTTGNLLRCWGRNASGQLGIGPSVDQAVATTVDPGESWYQVDTGYQQTCGVTIQGRLKCWGLNTRGEVGDGTTASRTFPVDVDVTTRYSAVSTGIFHSCAITLTGELRCWGANGLAELGTGNLLPRYVPTPAVFSRADGGPVISVSAGYSDTCAVTSDLQVHCTGENHHSLWGNGNQPGWTGRFEPAMNGVRAMRVSTGFQHACVLGTADNGGGPYSVHCAGSGAFGQNGSPTFQPLPFKVPLDLD